MSCRLHVACVEMRKRHFVDEINVKTSKTMKKKQIVTQASGFQILYMLGNMTSTRKYAIETGVIAYLGIMPCCVKTAKVHNNE